MTTNRKKALAILAAWGLVAAGAWAYASSSKSGTGETPGTAKSVCETSDDQYIRWHCDTFGMGRKK